MAVASIPSSWTKDSGASIPSISTGRWTASDAWSRENERRLVVLVSHVAEMREAIEDLIVLDKNDITGDTIVRSGAGPAA